MKTHINTLLVISLTVLLSLHLNSTVSFFIEQSSNNNQPTTENVANQSTYIKAISQEFSFDEETYIDDIPFNTENISEKSSYEEAISKDFSFDEEDSIDDTIY